MAGEANSIKSLIEEGIHPAWRRVDADLIDPLIASIEKRLGGKAAAPQEVARALVAGVRRVQDRIEILGSGFAAFNARHSVLKTEAAIQENILAYAAELGANAKQLRGDRKAFRRFFDYDAIVARYNFQHGDIHRELVLIYERLGVAAGRAIAETNAPEQLWREFDLESLLTPLVEFDGDARVATAAFRCLSRAISRLPESLRESVLGVRSAQAIYRMALDRQRDVWIQCEAVTLLRNISTTSFDQVARLRLVEPPADGDDFFVRRRLVPLVVARPELAGLLEMIRHDPSPYVRQALSENCRSLPGEKANPLISQLALHDDEISVRASALLQLPILIRAGSDVGALTTVLLESLTRETDSYVLRVALKMAADTHAGLADHARASWREAIMPALRQIHLNHKILPARRWAAQTRERIWCDSESDRRALLDRARAAAAQVAPGKSGALKDASLAAMDDEDLGRILSVAAQDDFGFDVVRRRSGIRFMRGHRFGFRFWRFIHEMRKPSPDKRQAFRHTIGRIFEGSIRVPSALLSEMSETKVPGEPLTLSKEGGWRPFLPLVDEILSALDENSHAKPLKIITSEGITLIRPPKSFGRRMRARWLLTMRFVEFARMRNSDEPAKYITGLRELGFECELSAPVGEQLEPRAAECYHNSSIPMLAFSLPVMLDRVREYFYSIYENSIGQLLVFLGLASTYFVGRHIYLNQVFFRLRSRIPLVVGGWGTRGKSGTERIKAALFNALGHRIVSKTTGCEAMFLYGDSFGKLHELFLFRPYDKATIWEQLNLVNLASRTQAHIFLWECMGLTPAYIEIIQRQWMRDDFSTIVNTYPDHEDVQGPAGVNIPEVMTFFIRRKGHVLTSEQQMTPILEAEALRLDCRMEKVGWIEPGLLTPDVLERFPYAEHPNNIALVVELGNQLGVPSDFSLKEMADRVVPDLGVLKVYPIAQIAGRRLQFVNGCSANERFGALGNWQRLGFDKQNPREEPGVWITGVVNNRADRIARSRVFASIVVQDIAVDRIFLIGSNLAGMVGYIREAFDVYVKTLTLFPDGGGSPADIFRETTHLYRLPASRGELELALNAIQGEGDLSPWREPYEKAYAEYETFAGKLGSVSDRKAIDDEFRRLLWNWYERKVVVIWDFYSTGEQTVHRICQETPPGYDNRIMGLQNIKGTGLDFVYRWQAWDACYNACQQIMDRRPKFAREGIAALASFKEFGLLSEETVRLSTADAAEKHGARDKSFQTQLDLVTSNMEETLGTIKSSLGSGDGSGDSGIGSKFAAWLFKFLEALFDAGDAVRRRKKANLVYRDIGAGRISPGRAAQEIQILNKRQKGGWLKKDYKAWKTKWSGS